MSHHRLTTMWPVTWTAPSRGTTGTSWSCTTWAWTTSVTSPDPTVPLFSPNCWRWTTSWRRFTVLSFWRWSPPHALCYQSPLSRQGSFSLFHVSTPVILCFNSVSQLSKAVRAVVNRRKPRLTKILSKYKIKAVTLSECYFRYKEIEKYTEWINMYTLQQLHQVHKLSPAR